jgi:hypothetical protein
MQQSAGTKGKGRYQNYIVFRQQDGNLWEELGHYEASGTTEAKKQAVEEKNLGPDLRRGEVTLVAIGARLWNPKTPTAEQQPDKIVW